MSGMVTPAVQPTIAVMFGGRSLEHDVSVVSGIQILHAIDPQRFAPMPIYIDQMLRWWIGDDLWHSEAFKGGGPDRSRLVEVMLSPGFGTSQLVPVGVAASLRTGAAVVSGVVSGVVSVLPHTNLPVTAAAWATIPLPPLPRKWASNQKSPPTRAPPN